MSDLWEITLSMETENYSNVDWELRNNVFACGRSNRVNLRQTNPKI
jgi:hypothetical protein